MSEYELNAFCHFSVNMYLWQICQKTNLYQKFCHTNSVVSMLPYTCFVFLRIFRSLYLRRLISSAIGWNYWYHEILIVQKTVFTFDICHVSSTFLSYDNVSIAREWSLGSAPRKVTKLVIADCLILQVNVRSKYWYDSNIYTLTRR